MSKQPVILLAEDDDNDVFFLRRALEKAQVNVPLHVVHHGREALDYLEGNGPFSDRTAHPLPSLILLDLKMPFFDGFEVLERMRSKPGLKDIPVCILTSSGEDRDRRRAVELGAKAYFVKPPTSDMIHEILGIGDGHKRAAISA